MTDFARMLVAAREASGLSQAELARRIPMNQGHLNRVEKGEREISFKKIERWFEVCGLTLQAIPEGGIVPAPPEIRALTGERLTCVLRLAKVLPALRDDQVQYVEDQVDAWERRISQGSQEPAISQEMRAKTS